MKRPKLTVFIPLRNDENVVRLIKDLERQSYKDFEVIVIDDTKEPINVKSGKLDLKYAHIEQVPTGVKFNMGADMARGEMILLMDSDAYPYDKDFLKKMVSNYKKGLVLSSVQIRTDKPFANFSGCLIPTELFRKIRVDPDTVLHYDTDWNFKLKRAGIPVRQVRDAMIVHNQRKDWRTRMKRARTYGKGWARLACAHKDNPAANFKWWRIGGARMAEGASIILVGIMTLAYGIAYSITGVKKKERKRR
ncbi:MAG: hypothetical protein DRO99_02330 [Candidatus Aenigmatarchaeota archaeon]|nr:MAG: hypothetical protein DRO99_02330 [Candidatus Aenigmarchaeota archaeon]